MHPVIKEIRQLAKKYGVKVRFKRLTGQISGVCEYWNDLIILDPQTYFRPELLSNFFHEYHHIYCFRNNLWPEYHSPDADPEVLKRKALKVERAIDRMAAMELYRYDKRVRYLSSYTGNDKEMKRFLDNYYDSCEE